MIKSEEYKHKNRGRSKALRLYPNLPSCVKCGSSESERYHKDGDTHNNEPSNIMALCRKCHMDEDGRLNKIRGLGLQKAIIASAGKKKSKQTCCRNHLLTIENVYIDKRGMRVCKECRKISKRKHYNKIKTLKHG